MNDPPAATIFEESSAESCIDPNNPNLSGSGNSGGGVDSKSPPSSSSKPAGLSVNVSSSSHVRTHSDSVQYTPVEVGAPGPDPASHPLAAANLAAAASAASSSAGAALRPTPTQYASVVNQVIRRALCRNITDTSIMYYFVLPFAVCCPVRLHGDDSHRSHCPWLLLLRLLLFEATRLP